MTLRSHHADAHYCAKNYKNHRHYGIHVKNILVEAGRNASVIFVSNDDKIKVCVASFVVISKYEYDCSYMYCLLVVECIYVDRRGRAPPAYTVLQRADNLHSAHDR